MSHDAKSFVHHLDGRGHAHPVPLLSTVKAAYQTNYRVKVCGCGFKQYFGATSEPFTGFESTENLMTSIMNVIDVINGQLETNVRCR